MLALCRKTISIPTPASTLPVSAPYSAGSSTGGSMSGCTSVPRPTRRIAATVRTPKVSPRFQAPRTRNGTLSSTKSTLNGHPEA